MTRSRTFRARAFIAVVGVLAGGTGGFPQGGDPSAYVSAGDWRQWGGPNRNFVSGAKGLADSWPATGPKVRWSRALR